MANIFQVDADNLHQVSNLFFESADEVTQTLQDLQSYADSLRDGWIGEGANAFFNEMEERVYPFLKSLADGLNATNDQITTMMKQTVDAENTIRARIVH